MATLFIQPLFFGLSLSSVRLAISHRAGQAEAAVEGAEGRGVAAEAGHVGVHRGDGQALRAQAAEAEALQDGARQGGGNGRHNNT